MEALHGGAFWIGLLIILSSAKLIEARPEAVLTCRKDYRWKNDHKNECEPCPVCPQGEGLPMDCGYGYGVGLTCKSCVAGQTYRSDLTKLKCVSCTDCSLYSREFKYQCRETIDAECGDCLEDYYDGHRNERDRHEILYPCIRCSDNPDDPDCESYRNRTTAGTQSEGQPEDTENASCTTILLPQESHKVSVHPKDPTQTYLILILLLAIALCAIFSILVICFYIHILKRQTPLHGSCGRKHSNDLCEGTSSSISMNECQPSSEVRKPLMHGTEATYEEIDPADKQRRMLQNPEHLEEQTNRSDTRLIKSHTVSISVEPENEETNEAVPPDIQIPDNDHNNEADGDLSTEPPESIRDMDSDTASLSLSEPSTLFVRNCRHDFSNLPPEGNTGNQPLHLPSQMQLSAQNGDALPQEQPQFGRQEPAIDNAINSNETDLVGIRAQNPNPEPATITITINNTVSSSPPNGLGLNQNGHGTAGAMDSKNESHIDLDSTTPKIVQGHTRNMSCGQEFLSGAYSIPVQESMQAKA